MNYFTAFDKERDWPQVSEADFSRVVDTFDYRRDAWSDAILYREKATKRLFGYVMINGRCFLHPDVECA